MPNMNDFRRGFGEENKDDCPSPDPKLLMYGNR